jgi:hypothetical protein
VGQLRHLEVNFSVFSFFLASRSIFNRQVGLERYSQVFFSSFLLSFFFCSRSIFNRRVGLQRQSQV